MSDLTNPFQDRSEIMRASRDEIMRGNKIRNEFEVAAYDVKTMLRLLRSARRNQYSSWSYDLDIALRHAWIRYRQFSKIWHDYIGRT